MKLAIWTLILALVMWSTSADTLVQDAMALSIGNTNLNPNATNTNTNFDGGTVHTVPNTATATSIPQLQHQQDTDNLNKQGSDSSSSLGMAAIAAGMAMVAAGMAMMASPPTAAAGAALVAAGMMLIAAGMAALAAAGNMDKNANKAAGFANNLGPTTQDNPPAKITPNASGDLSNNGTGSSIKIDPSLARNGKIATIMEDFQKKTGMSGEDLINGLNAGKSPMEILSNSPKVGKSESTLQSMMDKAIANNPPLNGADVMGKLGLTPEDLGAGTYDQSGGAGRGTASASPMADFDTLFGKNDAGAGAAGVGIPGSTVGTLSPDVQAALDRNGITSRSIFEMVHTTYQRKTPLMFGVKREQIQGVKPIYDLKGTAALEF